MEEAIAAYRWALELCPGNTPFERVANAASVQRFRHRDGDRPSVQYCGVGGKRETLPCRFPLAAYLAVLTLSRTGHHHGAERGSRNASSRAAIQPTVIRKKMISPAYTRSLGRCAGRLRFAFSSSQ